MCRFLVSITNRSLAESLATPRKVTLVRPFSGMLVFMLSLRNFLRKSLATELTDKVLDLQMGNLVVPFPTKYVLIAFVAARYLANVS